MGTLAFISVVIVRAELRRCGNALITARCSKALTITAMLEESPIEFYTDHLEVLLTHRVLLIAKKAERQPL